MVVIVTGLFTWGRFSLESQADFVYMYITFLWRMMRVIVHRMRYVRAFFQTQYLLLFVTYLVVTSVLCIFLCIFVFWKTINKHLTPYAESRFSQESIIWIQGARMLSSVKKSGSRDGQNLSIL